MSPENPQPRRRVRRRADRVWGWLRFAAFVGLAAAVAYGFHLIQDSRHDVIVRACREQNVKHDAAIANLDRLIADIPPGTLRRLRAERGRAGTITLIDALVPKRDCEKRADDLIR